jgi:Flp pilus assembly protein TadG
VRLPLTTRNRGQRGSLSLETAILFPVVFLILFGLVQGAWWYHARNVANAAANDGAAAARVENAPPGAGAEAARATADRSGSVLHNVNVSTAATATTVTVTVTGNATMILTDWKVFRITQSVTSPRERLTTPGG